MCKRTCKIRKRMTRVKVAEDRVGLQMIYLKNWIPVIDFVMMHLQ